MWLLDDWRNENCAIMLERCRASLYFLFDQFASLCWGLQPDDALYDDCPAEMFEAITFEDLWSQYLRLNTMARKAGEKSWEGEVEAVYKVVSARVRLRSGQEVCLPIQRLKMESIRMETIEGGSCQKFVSVKRLGEVELLSMYNSVNSFL